MTHIQTDRNQKTDDPARLQELIRLAELREELKSMLKPSRFEHSLGVSYTAAALAMKYGENIGKAQLAGLLHDCAKNYDDETLIALCDEHGVVLSEEERNSPKVIHAIYGEYLLETRFQLRDADVLKAVRYHTTGRSGMSLLEKIVFTADFIEPTRKEFPGLREIRTLAFQDLDCCVAEILISTILYLRSRNAHIVSDTMDAYAYFSSLTGRRIHE